MRIKPGLCLARSFQKIFLRGVALATLKCFVVTSLALGISPEAIAASWSSPLALVSSLPFSGIPKEMGKLDGVFAPPVANRSVFFLHIKDAHASMEAQRNINRILTRLQQRKQLDLVLIEGAAGPLTPGRLDVFDDAKRNDAYKKDLLSAGLLNGAAYFAAGQKNGLAHGLEDSAAYFENLKIFRQIAASRVLNEKFFNAIEVALFNRSKNILKMEVFAFLKEWKRHHQNTLSWDRYLSFLIRSAAKFLALDLRDYRTQVLWPHLVRYHRLEIFSEQIRSDAVQKEYRKLVQRLEKVREPALEETLALLSATVESPAALIRETPDFRKYVEVLVEACSRERILLQQFPNLVRYLAFRIFRSEIEPEELLLEVGRLEDALFEKLFKEEKSRNFIAAYRDFFLLKRAFALELDRAESKRFEIMDVSKRVRLLSKIAPGHDLQIENLIRGADLVKRFYKAAQKRDGAFAEQLRKALEGAQVFPDRPFFIVLVTGGYHAESLENWLRTEKLPFASIQPLFKDEPNKERYENLLRGDYSDFDALATPQGSILPDAIAEKLMGKEALTAFRGAEARLAARQTLGSGTSGDRPFRRPDENVSILQDSVRSESGKSTSGRDLTIDKFKEIAEKWLRLFKIEQMSPEEILLGEKELSVKLSFASGAEGSNELDASHQALEMIQEEAEAFFSGYYGQIHSSSLEPNKGTKDLSWVQLTLHRRSETRALVKGLARLLIAFALAGTISGCSTLSHEALKEQIRQAEQYTLPQRTVAVPASVRVNEKNLLEAILLNDPQVRQAGLRIAIRETEKGRLKGSFSLETHFSLVDGKPVFSGGVRGRAPYLGEVGLLGLGAGSVASLALELTGALGSFISGEPLLANDLAQKLIEAAQLHHQDVIGERYLEYARIALEVKTLQDQQALAEATVAALKHSLQISLQKRESSEQDRARIETLLDEWKMRSNDLGAAFREKSSRLLDLYIPEAAGESRWGVDFSYAAMPRNWKVTPAMTQDLVNRATQRTGSQLPLNRELAAAYKAREASIVTMLLSKARDRFSLSIGGLFHADDLGTPPSMDDDAKGDFDTNADKIVDRRTEDKNSVRTGFRKTFGGESAADVQMASHEVEMNDSLLQEVDRRVRLEIAELLSRIEQKNKEIGILEQAVSRDRALLEKARKISFGGQTLYLEDRLFPQIDAIGKNGIALLKAQQELTVAIKRLEVLSGTLGGFSWGQAKRSEVRSAAFSSAAQLLLFKGFESAALAVRSASDSRRSEFSLERDLDKAWSHLIKLRAGFESEFSGEKGALHSHHVFGKANDQLRWDIDNGVCLTEEEHRRLAHGGQTDRAKFWDWAIRRMSPETLEHLRDAMYEPEKPVDRRILLAQFRKEIEAQKRRLKESGTVELLTKGGRSEIRGS